MGKFEVGKEWSDPGRNTRREVTCNTHWFCWLPTWSTPDSFKKQKHIDVIGSTTTGCVWYISASANFISDPDLIRVVWQGLRLRLEE
jgi:hypothetical protein